MRGRTHPTWIGAFVVGAAALVVAGLTVFGSGVFAEKSTFVVFFAGNVSGLQVGAPVSFRGVRVGSVSDVNMLFDPEEVDLEIEVYVEIRQSGVRRVGGDAEPQASLEETIEFLIEERDMRAKLATLSIVTGQLYVDLDFYPDTPARRMGLDSRYPEIPTVPSDLQQITNRAREALAELRELPLAEIVETLLSSLKGIDRLVNSEEVDRILADLDGTIAKAGRSFDQVGRTFDRAERTLDQADEAFSIAAEDSPLRYQLEETLTELRSSARSIRLLADYLERHPEALVRGKAGEGGG